MDPGRALAAAPIASEVRGRCGVLSEAGLLDRREGSLLVHSFVVADLAQHISHRLERAVVGGERDVIGFCVPLRVLCDEGHVLVLGVVFEVSVEP